MKLFKKISTFFLYFHKLGVFRGIVFLIAEKMSPSKQIKIKISGVKNSILLRKKTSDIATFHQIFLYDEYNFHLNFEPKTIIDCGANIGLAAVYFKSKFKNCRVISIEPELTNFELLKENTKYYKDVNCRQCALSNEGSLEINVVNNGYGHWGFITEDPHESSDSNVLNKVQTVSINQILESEKLETVDLVKIDIEGYELEVFKSNTEWIAKTRCLVVELHDRMKPGSSKAVLNALMNHDFSMEISGENLIFKNNKFS